MTSEARSQTGTDGVGLKIINAGLFRMATKSMAIAYGILGYKTHHGLLENVLDSPYPFLEEAAEATWPTVPGARKRAPFDRKDWDRIWGGYDVVTDLASPFALELIKAYPDAKVVIVQRDFDTWWPSMKSQVVDNVLCQPRSAILGFLSWNLLGFRGMQAMRKTLFGFFGARSRIECYEHAREVYDNYFREVRRLVPPERRLEYKIGSGWEPLCEFLGVAVPDVPFPQVNDRKSHQEEGKKNLLLLYWAFARNCLPWIIGFVAIIWALVRYLRQ
jgi:hypothetical protein